MLLLHYLQTHQHLSRRKITQLIKEKKIRINDFPVQSFKQELAKGDRIHVVNAEQNLQLQIAELSENSSKQHMLLFHKPRGYTVSKSDPHNPTMYELLPANYQHRYYIGRLDKDSRGLVLLTPDPQLVHEYEHPSKHISKEYLVLIDRPLSSPELKKTIEGIRSLNEAGIPETLKCEAIKKIRETKQTQQLLIRLREGKKRHIRRIFAGLGAKVLDLQRITEGTFQLGDLPEGQRKLMPLPLQKARSISTNHSSQANKSQQRKKTDLFTQIPHNAQK